MLLIAMSLLLPVICYLSLPNQSLVTECDHGEMTNNDGHPQKGRNWH